MNFKLLTFIFVVIGVKSIDSSIINRSSIDNIVQISNLDKEIINEDDDNAWIDIKSLTFNASETVLMHGVRYPEVECKDYLNDFCAKGNGKYTAKIVECKNLDYGKTKITDGFDCKLIGARMLNKNVQYIGSYIITCANGFNKETAKGMCRMEYSFASSDSYNEADDVENKSFSAISKPSIDNLVQTSNLNYEVINSGDPFANIKSLTFNISDSVPMNGIRYSEVTCIDVGNDFCSRGNGKYQAKIVKCENLLYGRGTNFQCKLFNSKVSNKNVKYDGYHVITCMNPFSQETAKGRCRIEYWFSNSKSYNETDDVENKDKIN